MKTELFEAIEQAETIGIAGHIRPDGDCIGSCLAFYNYIIEQYNQNAKKQVHLYLENCPKEFLFLTNSDKIDTSYGEKAQPYDLFFSLDSSSIDRLGPAQSYFSQAKQTFCIDHHISNTKFADKNIVFPEASSTSEVVYDLLEESKISKAVAECIYLGIVHDTGVFKHSNTKERTMVIAGRLISMGAQPAKIIDETFYQKTYIQNQILGRCLLESILVMDGKVIVSYIGKKMQEFYNVEPDDLSGVIDQLRVTKGVEVAIFLKEEKTQEYKVSMRSNGIVDVSKIAVFFGGGGHIKAAGCTMQGSLHDVINNLTSGIEHQLKGAEKDKIEESI